MRCSELQLNLALFADGTLGDAESASIEAHFTTCPLCRQTADDYREMLSGLRRLRRANISDVLRRQVKDVVRSELHRTKRSWIPVGPEVRDRLQMWVLPYGVGVFASLLIGVTFLAMMFSGMLTTGRVQTAAGSGRSSIMLAVGTNPYSDMASYDVISPTDYARTRMAFSTESPSINPQGALIALTKSLLRGGMKDDEVVVVADVFGNGSAQVAEVVEPSRNPHAITALQKALSADPTYAPFVPASIDVRPESVRVVLRFQSVNVDIRPRPSRHRQKPLHSVDLSL